MPRHDDPELNDALDRVERVARRLWLRRQTTFLGAAVAVLVVAAVPVLASRTGDGGPNIEAAGDPSPVPTLPMTTTSTPSTTTTPPTSVPSTATSTTGPRANDMTVTLTASDTTLDPGQPVTVTAAIHDDSADLFHKSHFDWDDDPRSVYTSEGVACVDEDGVPPGPLDVEETGRHEYAEPGVYTVTVLAWTVECGVGLEQEASATLTIEVTEPAATWRAENDGLRVSVRVSDTTPDPGEWVDLDFRVVDKNGGLPTEIRGQWGPHAIDTSFGMEQGCLDEAPDADPDDTRFPQRMAPVGEPGTYDVWFEILTDDPCVAESHRDRIRVEATITVG